VVPEKKVLAEISEVFQRMMKTCCAISKLEYLLEAVRLIYKNVSMTTFKSLYYKPCSLWLCEQLAPL